MARFYSNENFPLPVVVELRRLGHDFLTSHDADQANQAIPDEHVLRFSTASNRILLTLNRRDFFALHKADSNHSSIAACTADADDLRQARRIHHAVSTHPPMRGVLLRINTPA